MIRIIVIMFSIVLMNCGVDMATSAAIGASSKAEEMKRAEKKLEKVRRDLDAAMQLRQQQLDEMDGTVR